MVEFFCRGNKVHASFADGIELVLQAVASSRGNDDADHAMSCFVDDDDWVLLRAYEPKLGANVVAAWRSARSKDRIPPNIANKVRRAVHRFERQEIWVWCYG